MSHPLVTFDPDDIRDSTTDAGLLEWARLLVDQVREAAASGQTVTVSAQERMLTPEQVGRRLNMHRSSVVRKILTGEIRAVKVGNRHRIPYSEFQRFPRQRARQARSCVRAGCRGGAVQRPVNEPLIVFADANVLAKPVTRTLILR